jgi:DNA topoisomerase-2
VHELPVGTWTDDYKQLLETMLVDYTPPKGTRPPAHKGILKHYTSHSTESTVMFELEFADAATLKTWSQQPVADAHTDCFEKQLKLTSKISLTNMHLFDADNRIHRYASVTEIIDAFYVQRIGFYDKRKEHMMAQLRHDMDVMAQKIRFIDGIVDESISVAKKTKADLVAMLEEKEFLRIVPGAGGPASYNYLLQMPIYSLTVDTLADLRRNHEEKATALAALACKTTTELWLQDLALFKAQYVERINADLADAKKLKGDNAKAEKKRKRAAGAKKGKAGAKSAAGGKKAVAAK